MDLESTMQGPSDQWLHNTHGGHINRDLLHELYYVECRNHLICYSPGVYQDSERGKYGGDTQYADLWLVNTNGPKQRADWSKEVYFPILNHLELYLGT
jgi:hypothetical protein